VIHASNIIASTSALTIDRAEMADDQAADCDGDDEGGESHGWH